MADLKLDVDIGSLLQADKAVRDFERRFSDLERAARRGAASQESLVRVFDRLDSAGLSLSQVYKSMERDLANSARTAARLENEFRSLTLSGKSARDSARAMEQAFREQEKAAEENARAVQEQARQYDMLRNKYDPLYAASQLYERSLNEIDLAHQKGAISAQRQAQLVDQLNAEYQQFSAGSAAVSNRFVANQMAMTGAVQGSARGINRLGVITQQSGYQIGDFLVQVQSGTNWMVAFGQQATQVAGTLTLLGGKWLFLGSALGIAIPLLTAVGAALMRTRGAAEDAADGIQTLSDRVRSARQQIADMAFEIEAMRRGFEDFREFALVREVEQAQDRVRELAREIYELEQLGTVTGPNERELELAQEALRLAQEQLATYQQSRQEHEGLTASMERGEEFANNLVTAYETLRNVMGEAGDEFKQGLVDQADALAEKVGAAEEEARQAAEEARVLKEQMAEAKREAEILAALDLKSGIEGASVAAQALAQALGVSLERANGILALSRFAQGRMQGSGGRGGDPRQFMPGADNGRFTPSAEIIEQADILLGLRSPRRGGGGGGGIGGLAQSLLTEMEQIELFRENALEQLENFNALELEVLGGHAEARLRIEEEYQNRLDNLRQTSRQNTLSQTASLFGALADIASVGGKKTVRAVAAFQAIEGTINAYGAAIKALNTPGITLAGRFAAYASVLAAGLKGVAAIRSAGGSVGGGGGGGVASVPAIASAQAAPEPQRVIIEGIDRDSLISGEQLSRLFDRLYEENSERGIVFSVAR